MVLPISLSLIKVGTNLIIHCSFETEIVVAAFSILSSNEYDHPLLILLHAAHIHPSLDLLLDTILVGIIILTEQWISLFGGNTSILYLTVDEIEVQIRGMCCKKWLRNLLKVETLQVDFKRRNVAFRTLARWTPMKILERESRWKVVCNKWPDTKLVAVYAVACQKKVYTTKKKLVKGMPSTYKLLWPSFHSWAAVNGNVGNR